MPTDLEHFAGLPGFDDTEGRAMEAVGMRSTIDWIATLPKDQAEAVLLRVVVGLDAESAAGVLGKRAGAVRTAAYRGLRRLAAQLDADANAGLPQPRPGRTTKFGSVGVTRPRPPAPEGGR